MQKNQDIDQKDALKSEEHTEQNKTIEDNQQTVDKESMSESENQDDMTSEDTTTKEAELSQEEKLQQALDQEKDKHLRLFAEFENYKRRTSKERLELFKTAGQEVIQSLLPVLDDFDRAMKELDKTKDKEDFAGINLIRNKLFETLKSKGLEPMNVSNGDSFDADLHEAITQIPAPSPEMKGKIIDVIEKGYTLGDKIIRYPKVVTGQ